MPGIISFLALATFSLSPLLTGAVAWVPNSSIVQLVPQPTISITGTGPGSATAFDDINTAAIPTSLISILTTAWSTETEENVFKRVVSSAGRLNINSTIQDVAMPYLSVTNISWLPDYFIDGDNMLVQYLRMRDNNTGTEFPHLAAQMSQPGAIALLTGDATSRANSTHGGYEQSSIILLNVAGSYREYRQGQSCDLSTTILGDNSQVRYWNGNDTWDISGCIALANVSFVAGAGVCETCRVMSNFTIQNATELKMLDRGYDSVTHALNDMPRYAPSLAPLLASFPDPRSDLDGYVKAFFIRSYSALWNAWTDAADPMSEVRESSGSSGVSIQIVTPTETATLVLKRAEPTQSTPQILQSKYQPASPTLQANVDATRVYVWLGVQLALIVVGFISLWMQTRLGSNEALEPGEEAENESQDTLVSELTNQVVNFVSSQ
ncbi:hypothetical protein FRC11_012608 [Ceratobasidium sp. 423]|nr:hypothetical protein FRC11_012608 [Ceratobasidium sp. 423]